MDHCETNYFIVGVKVGVTGRGCIPVDRRTLCYDQYATNLQFRGDGKLETIEPPITAQSSPQPIMPSLCKTSSEGVELLAKRTGFAVKDPQKPPKQSRFLFPTPQLKNNPNTLSTQIHHCPTPSSQTQPPRRGDRMSRGSRSPLYRLKQQQILTGGWPGQHSA